MNNPLRTPDLSVHDGGEGVQAVFWHPDVNALVIEVTWTTNDGDAATERYVWVDLAKVGIGAR